MDDQTTAHHHTEGETMYTLYISGTVCGQFESLTAAESRARRARALHPRGLSTVTIHIKTPTGAYVHF